MNNIIKFMLYVPENVLMFFRSLFWKRDRTIILVGAWFGEKFSDNSRYLYQYLAENKKQLGLKRVVWVTCNKKVYNELKKNKYDVLMMRSKESLEVHKHAGVHIVCNSSSGNGDILGQYSYGAKKINLWHGVNVKGIGYGSNEFKKQEEKHKLIYSIFKKFFLYSGIFRSFVSKGGWGNCYYLSSGRWNTRVMKQNLWLPSSHFVESNYPRNTNVIRMMPEEKEYVRLIKNYKYTILYLPTFRKGRYKIDIERVLHVLENMEDDYLVLYKPHPASEEVYVNNSIKVLPYDFDVNVIMPYITLLLTDYSSCANDAIYHKKKCLYFVPDIEEYIRGENGFLSNPTKYMCGPIIKDYSHLSNAIRKECNGEYSFNKEEYSRVRKMIWENPKPIEGIWEDFMRVI